MLTRRTRRGIITRMKEAIKIKTADEIAKLREAGRLAALVLETVCNETRPGRTTKELDDLVRDVILSHGARSAFLNYNGYPAQACISVNETIIHGIPDQRVVKDGDVVSIDVGVWLDGFIGDNAQTIPVNVSDPAVLDLLRNTERALHAGIDAARAGARLGDVCHAIEVVATQSRLSIVREFVGHGCGRELHEEPQIPNYGVSGRGPVLKEGMVLCIEPMLNLGGRHVKTLRDGWTVVTADGKPSAHFEHQIAITASGGPAEILTPRRRLFEENAEA